MNGFNFSDGPADLSLLAVKKFYPDGEILRRGRQLLARLQIGKFRPEVLWNKSRITSWPGDTEGRAMLALVLLGRALELRPSVIGEHWSLFLRSLNSRGYFGPINEGIADEQQLASHGWVLRALCEEIISDPSRGEQFVVLINGILDNLILPIANLQDNYPILFNRGSGEGGQSGTANGVCNQWLLSTDIGCNWILIDGLVQSLNFVRDNKLSGLIDVMIDKFLSVDIIGIGAQTHATLSALRGCLRYACRTKNVRLLSAVCERYSIFINGGMTANWSNYNWFRHPRWTEPCAVVDAFQLALGLWRVTGDQSYLNDAHRFWYTALGHGQRSNGGFGLDTCCGADPRIGGSGDFLGINTYEAHWCCTMRGAEGISCAVESTWSIKGGDLMLCLPNPGTLYLSDGFQLRVDTLWPYDGRLRIEVLSAPISYRRNLRIFIPEGCTSDLIVSGDGFVDFDKEWTAGEILNIDIGLPFCFRSFDKKRTIWRGPLMYAAPPEIDKIPADPKFTQESPFVWRCSDFLLTPLNDVFYRSDIDSECGSAWKNYLRKVVF